MLETYYGHRTGPRAQRLYISPGADKDHEMNLQILATEREKYFRAVKRLFARSLESTELLHLSVVCVWWGWLNWPWPVLEMDGNGSFPSFP